LETVQNKLCGRLPQYAYAPCKLTFDLLTLKVVSESRVTRPTYVTILVFLNLSVLDLGPMYATDRRQTDVIQTLDAHHRLMPPPYGGGGIISIISPWLIRNVNSKSYCR